MRLLSRYVLRQLAAPFVFAVAALTSIMLLNQIAKRFGALVGKGLPWSLIGEVFLLSLPFIVAMTLPMAVLLAVLYAFTTLASGNEITAMRASGVSIGQLLRPVFLAAMLLTVADFVFVDQGLPAANLRLKALLFDIGRKRPTVQFREQALNDVPPSSLFLRAGRIEPADGRLRDVTIFDMSGQQGRQVIYADSGRMGFEANQNDLYVTLYDGSILQFKGTDPGLMQLTYFTVNTMRVRSVGNTLTRTEGDVPKSDREMTTCEMLDAVHDTTSTMHALGRQRAERVEADLRSLLGLPRGPAASPDSGQSRGAPWCGWFRVAGPAVPSGDGRRTGSRTAARREPGPAAGASRPPRGRQPGPGLERGSGSGGNSRRRAGTRRPPSRTPFEAAAQGSATWRHTGFPDRFPSPPGWTWPTPRRASGPPGAPPTASWSRCTRSTRSPSPAWCSSWWGSRWRSAFPGAAWVSSSAAASGSSPSTTSASPQANRWPTPASSRRRWSCGRPT